MENGRLKHYLEKSFEETASTIASFELLSIEYENALKKLLYAEQHSLNPWQT